MDIRNPTEVLNSMIALILCLTFKEAGQALAAYWQGDKTAKHAGRLTLNPIPHMDPWGTILFPFIGALLGGFLFGWAKPLPIDARNFYDRRRGIILTAAAGPITNLLVSVIAAVIAILLSDLPDGSVFMAFFRISKLVFGISSILAVFHMIPIHPMDGGTILYELLPYEQQQTYQEYVVPYGSFALLAILLLGGFKFIAILAGVWMMFVERLLQAILG